MEFINIATNKTRRMIFNASGQLPITDSVSTVFIGRAPTTTGLNVDPDCLECFGFELGSTIHTSLISAFNFSSDYTRVLASGTGTPPPVYVNFIYQIDSNGDITYIKIQQSTIAMEAGTYNSSTGTHTATTINRVSVSNPGTNNSHITGVAFSLHKRNTGTVEDYAILNVVTNNDGNVSWTCYLVDLTNINYGSSVLGIFINAVNIKDWASTFSLSSGSFRAVPLYTDEDFVRGYCPWYCTWVDTNSFYCSDYDRIQAEIVPLVNNAISQTIASTVEEISTRFISR